ncbi:MAG: CotH kinase family protein [Acetatifactor sp.]
MSGFSRKKCIVFLTGCALFLLSSAWLLFFYMKYQVRDKLLISQESGICEEGTEITARIFREGTVFYSLNGEEVQEYEAPIVLSAGEDGCWYDMSFFCVFADGEQTETQERTYFVTRSEEKPVGTDYIVSVWGDEAELFGEEKGLFVRGTQFEEYMAENPDVDLLGTIIPANYFSNEEIAVHSVIFNREGERLIDQDCGLRIYGAVTRAKNQKSFRLMARYAYDDANTFDYPFFPQLLNENGGELLKYKKLSFHNSGNDNGYGFIRNQLCNELARQAGFPDVLVSKSAAVYVNNRYMGVYWLQNAYGEGYFKEKYGEYAGEMITLEGAMIRVSSPEDEEERLQAYADEYNDFCQWVAASDVQDDAVWTRVTDTIDVENFLQYVAIEYYVNNLDWPHNNLKIYRYLSEDGIYYEDSVFDGRYRYLLFDLDYGMGLKFLGYYGRDAYTESLKSLCEVQSSSALFAKVMQREDCRNMFINDVLNLRNGSFAPGNVEEVLNQLNDSRWSELVYMMEETDILKDSLWESDDNDINHVQSELKSIVEYAKQRQTFVMEEMSSVWETGSPVALELSPNEQVQVNINGTEMSRSGEIVYFSAVPIEISVKANEGIYVKGYFVNESYVEGSTIWILPGEYAENGIITIVPDWEEEECESLRIDSCRTSGTQDYVVLKNTGNVNIHLNEYYLSDDEEDIFKNQLPDKILKPGETITFYGEKYDSIQKLGVYRLTFSWKDGEEVILSHMKGGIIEKRSADSVSSLAY